MGVCLLQGGKVVAMTPGVVEYFLGVHLLVCKVAAGSHHCLAVTQDKELYSWGSNNFGCLSRCVISRVPPGLRSIGLY
jgi:alpha-tubulin suppressor-like RCC1 family protein